MNRARNHSIRRGCWVALLAWGGAPGCIHNHYYGALPPGCAPVVTPAGSVCDVPAGQASMQVSGSPSKSISSNVAPAPGASASAPAAGTVVGQPSTVIVSQPAFGLPPIGQGLSRLKWKRPDPEGVATTKVEGAYDDSTVRQ